MNEVYRSPEGRRLVEGRYRELLASWPVPVERRHVPTRRGDTFVVSAGPPDAPPLVLLHGSGGNALTWRDDMPVWAGRFRVHAVDVLGEPGLSEPVRLPLADEEHALWLDEVLGGLEVDRAAVAGMSLGGRLALDYAVRRPGRVERLVLLCPGGVGRQKTGAVLLASLLLPFGRRARIRAMDLVLGPRPATPQDREIGEYVAFVHENFRPRRDRLPVFSDADLASLTMPVLVIVGDRDPMFDSRATLRRLPRAEHVLLENTGHLIVGQARRVLDFLGPERRRA
ncbi:alpha/beta hydrolase [Actinomadura kijaniata]|uniref:Pimeloyl-ACP methyl ester carboxylesterase n=1 Tax=Actinomadura namibiensis TaxID=182080 RepID=A0A7W3LVQ3_ACTNM|nr:alpha/beta hydrolase [Actinomadura namibiensis]MBA8955189.1 pimeloyl-ACP methyl ester carboxylesterase [Actinomadura namibiensis]